MGIGSCTTRMILEEHKRSPFAGKVLQLGRQDIRLSIEEFKAHAQEHQVPLRTTSFQQVEKADIRDTPTIDDRSFFTALGFESVESLDASAFEKAEIIWDLNQPIPEKYHSSYDLIYDGGTLEHVFHTPIALENIFHLLKPGGRIIHHSPANNYVDHGFYSFSPTLFYDYYTANGFDIEKSYITENEIDHFKPVEVYEYRPGSLDHLSFGGFVGGKMLAIFFVARKKATSTGDRYPTQGHYQKTWPELNPTKDKAAIKPDLFVNRHGSLLPQPVHLHPLASAPVSLPADLWQQDRARALAGAEFLLHGSSNGIRGVPFFMLWKILTRKISYSLFKRIKTK